MPCLSKIALNWEKKSAEGGGGVEPGLSTYLCSSSSPVFSQNSGTMLGEKSIEGAE